MLLHLLFKLLYCYQTTYKELKRISIQFFGALSGCYQTTYKELKPVATGVGVEGYQVIRLPIRN